MVVAPVAVDPPAAADALDEAVASLAPDFRFEAAGCVCLPMPALPAAALVLPLALAGPGAGPVRGSLLCGAMDYSSRIKVSAAGQQARMSEL